MAMIKITWDTDEPETYLRLSRIAALWGEPVPVEEFAVALTVPFKFHLELGQSDGTARDYQIVRREDAGLVVMPVRIGEDNWEVDGPEQLVPFSDITSFHIY